MYKQINKTFLLSFLSFAFTFNVFSQKAKLVADINKAPIPYGSKPEEFYVFKDKLYFSADTKEHGRELWVYEPKAGASLLMDIRKGEDDSNPKGFCEIDGLLYFSAKDEIHGSELWVCDGVNPPHLALDIVPGTKGSNPNAITPYMDGLVFIAYGDDGYFTYYLDKEQNLHVVREYQLNVSMGTRGLPVDEGSKLLVVKNRIYSVFDYTEDGLELGYIPDTTQTTANYNVMPGIKSSNPRNLIKYKDQIYCVMEHEAVGRELFGTKGENSLGIVYKGYYGNVSSNPRSIKILNDSLWWVANDSLGNAWVHSNAGGDTTRIYKDDQDYWNSEVEFSDVLASYKGKFIYKQRIKSYNPHANIDVARNSYRSKSDYSSLQERSHSAIGIYNRQADTQIIIKTTDGIPLEFSDRNGRFAIYQDQLVFCANDGCSGDEVWAYDGENPAYQLADISKASLGSNIHNMVALKEKLYMVADDGSHGHEVWEYDGNGKARMLKDIEPGEASSNACMLFVMDDKFYFQATQNGNTQVFVYDGAGEVKELNNGFQSVQFTWSKVIEVEDDKFYFQAESTDGRIGRWLYSGEKEPEYCPNINDDELGIYFNRNNFPYWSAQKTTDTKNEQDLLKEFNSKHRKIFDDQAYHLNGKNLVLGFNPETGYEPYIYDSKGLPQLLMDFLPGPKSSNFEVIIEAEDKIYFSAFNSNGKYTWWFYDGQSEPKQLHCFDDEWTYPETVYYFQNKLYFISEKGYDEKQLWCIDEKSGPRVVTKNSEKIRNVQFIVTGESKMFFIAEDKDYDYDIWEYDGKDFKSILHFNYLPSDFSMDSFYVSDEGYLFFAGISSEYDGVWFYDGKNEPYVISNIKKKDESRPTTFHRAGHKVYFLANDGINGEELWSVDLNDLVKY